MKQAIAPVVIGILLGGCASAPTSPSFAYTPGNGCLITSIADERGAVKRTVFAPQIVQNVYRFGVPRPEHLQLAPQFGPGFVGPKDSFETANSVGVLHVRFLEPGQYFIGPYVIVRHMAGSVPKVSPRGFRVPFDIEPGKCTYLGRSTLQDDELHFRWTNELPSDLAIAKKLLPPELLTREPTTIAAPVIPPLESRH